MGQLIDEIITLLARRHAASEGMTACAEDLSHMSIHIDSCAVRETIVVNTRSSVYELIVLRDGDVLVRGGRHFTEFRRVLFLGSTADDSSLKPRTIDIGLRMNFRCGDRFIITSPVQSLSRRSATASTGCATAQ